MRFETQFKLLQVRYLSPTVQPVLPDWGHGHIAGRLFVCDVSKQAAPPGRLKC